MERSTSNSLPTTKWTRDSLTEVLVEAPGVELEYLFQQVLEKRPELMQRIVGTQHKPETSSNSKPVKISLTVEWDPSLTSRNDMYRDDSGGWVSAERVQQEKLKIVGKDYRNLPIVHIGKGRPRKGMITRLMQDPKAEQTGSQISDQKKTAVTSQVTKLTVYSLENPRTSSRLQRKRTLDQDYTSDNEDSNSAECKNDKLSLQMAGGVDLNTATTEQVFGSTIEGGPIDIAAEESVMSEGSKAKQLECSDCHMTFRSAMMLRRHLVSPSCVGFNSKCYLCGERYDDDQQLRFHEYNECLQTFQAADGRGVDWLYNRFLCSHCGNGFPEESALQSHCVQEHDSSPGFVCRQCLSGFTTIRALKNHNSNNHTTTSVFPCHICNHELSSKRSLEQHLKRIHDTTRPQLQCPLCDKLLKSKRSMEHHINSIHENNRPFKCEFCDKAFVTKSNLDVHEKAHRDIRDFVCEICGASFVQKVRLVEHIRAHKGVREFVCEVCHKAFVTKKDLKCHGRTHTQEKPYSCKNCDKTFGQSQSLKKHEMTHQTQTPLNCQFCNKSFKSTGAVYRHCRIEHKEKLKMVCDRCNLSFISEADLNRHNHYKHIGLYDGRSEEKTFLASATTSTNSAAVNSERVTREDNSSCESVSLIASSSELLLPNCNLSCVCGHMFNNVTELTKHSASAHPRQTLTIVMNKHRLQ